MRSGLLHGGAAWIDGMAERIEAELGQAVTIVVTGGLSPLLQGHTRREAIFDETLLLEGLRLIYEINAHRLGNGGLA
jgi:type III pantothenate kinase